MTLETKHHLKNIFLLAMPIIMENIFQTLLGTTDTYFAGKLADNAIAGIGVTNLIMNIFISFFTAISVGTTAIISRNYGRKDFHNVNRTIVHSIALGIILGIITGGICFLFGTPILQLSGADTAIIQSAMPYYLVVAVPCIILCLQLILSSCLRAIKDTKTPMYVTGASNILNICLNILFMKMGLGILGLGLATTLSRCISMIILFLRLRNYNKNIHLSLCNLSTKEFSCILKVGVPAGLEKLIMRIGQLIYNGMIISIGTASYVAHNIAGNIESYSYIPAMGFGLAVCTMVGISLGEDNITQAKKQTAIAYYISVGFMVLIGSIFFIFAPQLAALFTNTKEIQDLIVAVLRIIALFQPFTALVQIMTNALQGAGDTKFPMYSTLIGIWGIRIGVGYVLAVVFKLGLIGVWWAYALDVVVRGLLLLQRFYKGKWQELRL